MILLQFLTGIILGTLFMEIVLVVLNTNYFEPIEKKTEDMEKQIKDFKELLKAERELQNDKY